MDEKIHGTLLVVDDQRPVRQILQRIFEQKGITVYTTAFAHEALRMLQEYPIDVVLSDISMPDFSGLELLKLIKKYDNDICVVMITGSQDIQTAKSAFRLGAYDFLTKPFDPDDAWISISRALEYRHLILEQKKYREELESIVAEKTSALQNVVMELDFALEKNREAHLETTIVLAKIAEINDEDTGNHLKRVSRYCEHLSRAMQLPDVMVDTMTYSSMMHDIGKIFVNSAILKKSGSLTSEEFEMMKLHTIYGGKILENVPFLQTARDIALYHHENYDGSGYPYSLQGEAIPLSARIVALCDVFDALITTRCYKQAYNLETSLTIIKSEIGRRFDPEIADVFLKIKNLMYQIYMEFTD